jgi:PKD repeat protein
MKRGFMYAGLIVFCFPLFTSASVTISEVAWMGTATSANDEWLELFNDGTETVSLSDYTLSWGSESSPKNISLEGTISPNGYFLLERTDDESVPTISADQIYVGALSNTGEKMLIKQGEVIVFTLDATSGWPGGDNTSKNTLQWNGSSWITAPGTPKVTNTSLGVATTTSDTESLPSDDEEEETNNNTPLSSHSSPSPLYSATYQGSLRVSAGRDRLGIPSEPILFEAYLFDRSGNRLSGALETRWSFGDGTESQGEKVWHTYYSPGTYTVLLTAILGNNEAVSRARVTIVSPNLEVKREEGGVEIANKGTNEVNLGGWKLFSDNTFFTLAKDTILPVAEILPIPDILTKFSSGGDNFSLQSPSNTFFFKSENNNPNVHLELSTSTKIQELQILLDEKKKELALYASQTAKRGNFSTTTLTRTISKENVQNTNTSTETLETTALVLNRDPGVFERMLVAPVRVWRVLKERIF